MAKSQYPVEAKTFGEKIRKKRLDLGWTLIKVSDIVGISESYLARLEADKQEPAPDVAIKILDALKADKEEHYPFLVIKALNQSFPEKLPDSSTTNTYAWEKVLEIIKALRSEIEPLPSSKRARLTALIDRLEKLAKKNAETVFRYAEAVRLALESKK